MSRRTRLTSWGEDRPPVNGDWRRNRDWVERHTIAAVAMGVAAVVAVGLLTGAFGEAFGPERTPEDLTADELRAAHPDHWQRGYDDGFQRGQSDAIAVRLYEFGPDLRTPWSDGFRDGDADGWNDALSKMRELAVDARLPLDAVEFRVLDSVPRREW